MKAKEDHIARRESYIKGKSRTGRIAKRPTDESSASAATVAIAAITNADIMELDSDKQQPSNGDVASSIETPAPKVESAAATIKVDATSMDEDKVELTTEEVEAAAKAREEAKQELLKRKRTMKSRRRIQKHNKWIVHKRGGDGILNVPAHPTERSSMNDL